MIITDSVVLEGGLGFLTIFNYFKLNWINFNVDDSDADYP